MTKRRAEARNPLRVAIISPTFGSYGGLEAFVLALCAGLPPGNGMEVTLYFKRTKHFVASPELAAAAEPLGNRVRFINRGSHDLWNAVSQADVIHAQNPIPDAILLAAFRRRPVLVNVINHRVPGASWRQRLWDVCLRRADRRFYISDFVRRSWEGDAIRHGSFVVFPICRLAEGPRPPADRKGFVFAARWVANKGVDALVEAYAQAALDPDEWPLTLIGDGPLRPAIARRVEELRLRGVAMPGFLSEQDKAEAFRSARFLVAPPDTSEDFGLTAIEARHLHVPCIVTRDGGLPEAAGPDAILCQPGDVKGLAAALKKAAAMPESVYADLAERAYHTLLPTLAHPSSYAQAYLTLGGRG